MQTVNLQEAKTNLAKLIEAVARGQEFVIAEAGKPVAKLVPIGKTNVVRKPGALKGKIHITDDFDAPLPDALESDFEDR